MTLRENFRPRYLVWQKIDSESHCNSSALLHLFHNQGHPSAGKLGQFAQDSYVVKGHKSSPSVPYPICFASDRPSIDTSEM